MKGSALPASAARKKVRAGKQQPPSFWEMRSAWADSVFAALTPEEKIGQLMMIGVYSNRDSQYLEETIALIRDNHIGGVIFFQGGPYRQAQMLNRLQPAVKVPLLAGMDAEWGLSMRLDSVMSFPRQMALGALQDNELIYEMGREIARQCRRLGVNLSFSPVADINNNPRNPVIGDRSFGEDKELVAAKSIAYMKGLQDGGVLACAKHFPGHGDTDKDSHKTLPVILHGRERMDSVELYPFRKLIEAGVGSIMTAHLFIPAYGQENNTASSLSPDVVTGLLKDSLGFRGLVVTDALNMKGVTAYFKPGEIEVRALLAGNDLLLFPSDVPKAIEAIKKAVADSVISQSMIDGKVMKILRLKQWCGLDKPAPVPLDNLYEDLHEPFASLINRRAAELSVTLLRNEGGLLPFKNLAGTRFASVSLMSDTLTPFQEALSRYVPCDHFYLPSNATSGQITKMLDTLTGYGMVVAGIHSSTRPGVQPRRLPGFVHELMKKLEGRMVTVSFGSPYSLGSLDSLPWLVAAYEDSPWAQDAAAQFLFGSIRSLGRLPVTPSSLLAYGIGLETPPPSRLKFTEPEEAGVDRHKLAKIDSIVLEAIRARATPGCQVLVARDGMVIYQRSFGYHTYDNLQPVRNTDLYDLASLTKIASTTLAVMRLYEQQRIHIEKPVSAYLPELHRSNKKNIVIRDVLLHRAGLRDWIAFYLDAIRKGEDIYFCNEKDDLFCIPVAQDMYMSADYMRDIWNSIAGSRIRNYGEYRYSDLGFYLMQDVVEKISGTTLDTFVSREFYEPLGLTSLCYRPLEHFPADRIVPSEYDRTFRKQVVHGYVNDPGAAMLGGVAGHAGLFSHATDLAVLMQMLLNGGSYGGVRYFDPATVQYFTKRHLKDNRRGLGFDKPEPADGKASPACRSASPSAFGHLGFTGTAVWADPEYGLVFVFLSNRTYPDSENRKLLDMNVRGRVQEAVYEAIKKGIAD